MADLWPVDVDLLREVILVEAVLQCDHRATEVFLAEFRPTIEKTLLLVWLGRSRLDELDDIINDLLVPRDSRPPRLENFHGKAPLNSWLRTVVRRTWTDLASRGQESRGEGRGTRRAGRDVLPIPIPHPRSGRV